METVSLSTIFLDESGYTDQDLLNQEQPIFTLASLILSGQVGDKLSTYSNTICPERFKIRQNSPNS